jgi:hypothetical protein
LEGHCKPEIQEISRGNHEIGIFYLGPRRHPGRAHHFRSPLRHGDGIQIRRHPGDLIFHYSIERPILQPFIHVTNALVKALAARNEKRFREYFSKAVGAVAEKSIDIMISKLFLGMAK